MAGTRQYATNADVPFELFDRGSNTTLADIITTANADGASVTEYNSTQLNAINGISAVNVQGSGYTGGANVANAGAFDVTARALFDNASGSTGAANSYHIHVIRDRSFLINRNGGFIIAGNTALNSRGTHIVWINCDFVVRDSLVGASPTEQWIFQNGDRGTGNAGGYSLLNNLDSERPGDITGESLATTRTHNFFGCSFTNLSDYNPGTGGISAGAVRLAVGEMHDSLFIQASLQQTAKHFWLFSQPGCLIRNTTISAPGTVSIPAQGPNRIWLTGPVQLDGADTRGVQVAVADNAQVKAFSLQGIPGAGIAAFNTGNSTGGRLVNDGYSYLKSINPSITIGATVGTQTNLATALSYVGGQQDRKRYIELVQYAPTFREVAGAGFAEGISFSNDYGWSWQAGDTLDRYPDADNTVLTNQSYTTNAQGIIAGANLYIPDTGRTGTIEATGAEAGLQIPVAVFGQQAGDVSQLFPAANSVIRYRAFFQDVEFTGTDERGTYADGEVTLTINKGFLDTRATGANAGTAVGAGADFVTPIDTTLSTAARGRTLANLDDYFDDATNGILIGTNAISTQDISDVLKWQHYRRNTDSYRTVSDAGVVTTDFNISVNATATDAVSIATDTIVLRTAGFNSGTGTGAGTTGPVTSLVTTGNIDLDGTTLVDTNITAAQIGGISTTGTAISGGSVTGELTGLNGQSIIVDGDPDLSGVTVPAGETLTVSGTFTAGRAPTGAGITVLSTIAINGLINPGGTDALRGYLTAWDVGTNNTLTRIPLNRIVDQDNAQATTDTAATFAGRVSTAATSINITGINDTSTTRVVLTHPNFRTQVMEIAGGGTLQFVPASISVPAETLIPNGVSIAVADADAAITGAGTDPDPFRLTLTVTSPFANPPGPTEVNALLHRDIKSKLQYQRLIALLSDGADGINDDETILSSPSNASPAGLNGNFFNLVPTGTTIQGLGFINNLDPADRNLSTAALAAGNVVAGVLVFPETMFDLALTVSELTEVVSSQTYINDVTNPSVNAIRNFLQLSDN